MGPGSRSHYFLRLWRLALRRLRYLCFDIFFRRFLMSEPMQLTSLEGGKPATWSRTGQF